MTHEHPEPLPHEAPPEPRLRVVKGAPWRVDGSRRAKWSSEEFLRQHAVAVHQIGDPVLHVPAKKPRLSKADLEALVARMFASMIGARGIGIAAPQIGLPLRIAIMDVDEAGLVCVDPVVEAVSGELAETTEGCLSVRGFYGVIERPLGARVSAIDLSGKRFVVEGRDLGAQCLLHETDHLNGTLYVDRLRSREDLHTVEPERAEEAVGDDS